MASGRLTKVGEVVVRQLGMEGRVEVFQAKVYDIRIHRDISVHIPGRRATQHTQHLGCPLKFSLFSN